MYASNGGSHDLSQGTANATRDGKLNEPVWFTQTLGTFGSVITNA